MERFFTVPTIYYDMAGLIEVSGIEDAFYKALNKKGTDSTTKLSDEPHARDRTSFNSPKISSPIVAYNGCCDITEHQHPDCYHTTYRVSEIGSGSSNHNLIHFNSERVPSRMATHYLTTEDLFVPAQLSPVLIDSGCRKSANNWTNSDRIWVVCSLTDVNQQVVYKTIHCAPYGEQRCTPSYCYVLIGVLKFKKHYILLYEICEARGVVSNAMRLVCGYENLLASFFSAEASDSVERIIERNLKPEGVIDAYDQNGGYETIILTHEMWNSINTVSDLFDVMGAPYYGNKTSNEFSPMNYQQSTQLKTMAKQPLGMYAVDVKSVGKFSTNKIIKKTIRL